MTPRPLQKNIGETEFLGEQDAIGKEHIEITGDLKETRMKIWFLYGVSLFYLWPYFYI